MPKYVYVMNSEDTETREIAERLVYFAAYILCIGGSPHSLAQVGDFDELAIIAHGTSEPAVSVKVGPKKKWSATEVAHQLRAEGLSLTHRNIVLFVCEAASSTNTVRNANTLSRISNKFYRQTPEKQATTRDKVEAKYKAIAEKVPTLTDMQHWNTQWLLPFGAALMQELKTIHFENMMIICYKFCVSQHCTGGHVWLQDPVNGDRQATEADKVKWH